MQRIISLHPYIPMRSEPAHRSEQVSQLLFGETASVTQTNGEWSLIRTTFDDYSGWVENRSVSLFAGLEGEKQEVIVCTPLQPVFYNGYYFSIPCGSELPASAFQEGTFRMMDRIYRIEQLPLSEKDPVTLALQFMHAPYLWGGRTIMGIDCSGLTQIVHKACGISLPRDASAQINHGRTVPTVEVAERGDLCFFHNDSHKITHVGLYMGNGQIIHASKSVRIDTLDEQGIFSSEWNDYTHKLNSIRRLESR